MKTFADKLYKVQEKYVVFEEALTTVIFILMCASIFFQILCRFVLKISVPWTEELVRYSFIAVSFVGMGAVQMKNNHIRVDLLVNRVNKIQDEQKREKVWLAIELLRNIIILILGIYVAKLCLTQFMIVYKMGQLTPALKIPMWILNGFIVYGFLSLVVHTVCRIIILIFGDNTLKGGAE